MRIAYLILAHNNPSHLGRLINALSSDSSMFFVHIDKKSKIRDFKKIQQSNVFINKKRIVIYRSHFSMVSATLSLLKIAFENSQQFDRFVLLSGTDYPLHSSQYIEKFFSLNPTSEYINIIKMPADDHGKPISRLIKYKITPSKLDLVNKIMRKFMRIGIFPKERNYKKYLDNLIPYGGSQWWALTRDACSYILQFIEKNKSTVKFFRNTNHPEEMFFQILLGNSQFFQNMKRNLTFTDWRPGKGWTPRWISEEHLELFGSKSLESYDSFGPGELLFARKFSDDAFRIVEALDRLIIERNGS